MRRDVDVWLRSVHRGVGGTRTPQFTAAFGTMGTTHPEFDSILREEVLSFF